MARIKVGQIGVCHEHAAGKMKALRLHSEVFDIVGVVDDRATTAAKFAGSDLSPYEGLTWLTEEQLFDLPGLQAVAVEVPNLDLVPTAFRCLERRLPIHMDKPGGEDLAAFTQLRQGYEKLRLPLQMGYMFRGNPAMRWLRGAVRGGLLGDVFEVQGSMSHDYGGDAYQEYIGRFRGGIVFNLVCHLLDWLVETMGRPVGVTPFLKATPDQPDPVRNNGLVVLEYPRPVVTLRACSREVGGLDRRVLKVCGTKGTAELCPLERFDGQPLRLELRLNGESGGLPAGAHSLAFGPVRDRYEDQLLDWGRMIRGEIPEPHDARHDCLVQEVLLAAAGYTEWKA